MATHIHEIEEGWKEKWTQGRYSWHRSEVSKILKKYLSDLTQGEPTVSILVPWCGKSLDLPWLCSEGYDVVGIELSEIAAQQLFQENSIPYSVSNEGEFAIYQAQDRKLKIINGSYYGVTPEIAGKFEAVWDVNAFGAVMPDNRQRYIAILMSLLKPKARVLLSNWEFGETQRDRAPFSLPCALVKEIFQEKFEVTFLEKGDEFSEHFISRFEVDWAHMNAHLLSL